MKILYYNWADLDDCENRGGGVSIYLKNVISEFELHENIQIYFLCGGRHFDYKNKKIYIKEIENTYSEKARVFRIYNSPCVAPAHLAYNQIKTYLEDTSLREIFADFFRQYGTFDIVHFHNLEGLTLSVLKLKEEFKDTKFIYTLHNYFPFCPQVNLWMDGRCNCNQDDTSYRCMNCKPMNVITDKVKKKLSLSEMIDECTEKEKKQLLKQELDKVENEYENYQFPFSVSDLVPYFKEYRKKNVNYINKYIDIVLAVSKRTGYIAKMAGIKPEKILVNYIGTKVADIQGQYKHIYDPKKELRIIYMGQMRADKGFYFFLEALEKMPNDIAKKIAVTVAAGWKDDLAVKRLRLLSDKFFSVNLRNGYTHNELSEILSDIDIGIVPVLWEDNLPQISVEMIAYGVAVLTSDLGGTRELSSNSDFCFKAGDFDDFIAHLEKLQKNDWSETYWSSVNELVSMRKHIADLISIYKSS